MNRSTQILAALRALCAAAIPNADISGFTEDVSRPDRVGANGALMGDPGDPGDPEYDLSPIAFTYTHRIPVDLCLPAYKSDGSKLNDAALTDMLAPIGASVIANRSLGGLCNWLEVTAAKITSDDAAGMTGAVPLRVASFDFVAEYTVSDPLGA